MPKRVRINVQDIMDSAELVQTPDERRLRGIGKWTARLRSSGFEDLLPPSDAMFGLGGETERLGIVGGGSFQRRNILHD